MAEEKPLKSDQLSIIDESGNTLTITVIDIFELEKYPEREYILYSFDKEITEESRFYVSILNETENDYSLDTILDNEEWQEVQKGISEITDYSDGEIDQGDANEPSL